MRDLSIRDLTSGDLVDLRLLTDESAYEDHAPSNGGCDLPTRSSSLLRENPLDLLPLDAGIGRVN